MPPILASPQLHRQWALFWALLERQKRQAENCMSCLAGDSSARTLCSLLSIESHFGKLAFYHWNYPSSSLNQREAACGRRLSA